MQETPSVSPVRITSRKELWQKLYLPHWDTMSLSIDPRSFFNVEDKPYDTFNLELSGTNPTLEFVSATTGRQLFSILSLESGITFLNYERGLQEESDLLHIQYMPARYFPKSPKYGQPLYIGANMRYLADFGVNKAVIPFVDCRGFVYRENVSWHLAFFTEADYLTTRVQENTGLSALATTTVNHFETERGTLSPPQLYQLEKQDRQNPPFSDLRFRYCLTQIIDWLI